MSLIYRAIWQDDRSNLIATASDTFIGWARAKHGDHLEFEPEPSTYDGITTSLVTVDANGVQAAVAEMTEDSATDRWMTRQRVLIGSSGEQWIWVDVERTTNELFRAQDIAAPNVVKQLLEAGHAGGGNPRIGSIALRSKASVVMESDVEKKLVSRITDPDRAAPIVVYTHDSRVSVDETMKRATTAQEILAGLVEVVVLTPPAESVFVQLLGRDLAVWGGAVRLYLPGPMKPSRHRYFLPDVVERHHREVGRRIARALSGAIAARRAPAPFEEVRSLLRGQGGKSADELLQLADQEIADRDRTIEELSAEIQRRDEQLFDRAVDLDDLEDQLAAAKQTTKYWMNLALHGPETEQVPEEIPESASSLSEAALFCQLYLPQVVLPDEALRDLNELDTAPEASGWSKASWRAFKALAAYVDEASSTKGGFWEWCKNSPHPDTWPASTKKLSMSESESVMNNKAQRAARLLPVSLEVDRSGFVEMEAHMKIAEGGGTDIPRIYFHDDTKGPTRKVHVGFFGPHRYMENTKT